MKTMRILIAVVVLAVMAASLPAGAATVSYNDTILSKTTNWIDSFTLTKFDGSLGTLNSITFTLQGTVLGDAKFESLDTSPTTVTMNLSSILTLQRPDLSTLVQVIPLCSTTDNAGPFDTVIDFVGESGKTYIGLSNTAINDFTSPPPASDLALFTGSGNIILPITATGHSTGSGSGNLLTQFSSNASALGTIVYNYTPVPEPSSMVALLAGIGGLAGLIRRRRNR